MISKKYTENTISLTSLTLPRLRVNHHRTRGNTENIHVVRCLCGWRANLWVWFPFGFVSRFTSTCRRMNSRKPFIVGTMGLTTARRAKISGNLPHVYSQHGVVVIHTKCWRVVGWNSIMYSSNLDRHVDIIVYWQLELALYERNLKCLKFRIKVQLMSGVHAHCLL